MSLGKEVCESGSGGSCVCGLEWCKDCVSIGHGRAFILPVCIRFWIIKSVYCSCLASLQLQTFREASLGCFMYLLVTGMADGEVGVESQLHPARNLIYWRRYRTPGAFGRRSATDQTSC
jgi:hypothetical protein